jgi:hypothetical protein
MLVIYPLRRESIISHACLNRLMRGCLWAYSFLGLFRQFPSIAQFSTTLLLSALPHAPASACWLRYTAHTKRYCSEAVIQPHKNQVHIRPEVFYEQELNSDLLDLAPFPDSAHKWLWQDARKDERWGYSRSPIDTDPLQPTKLVESISYAKMPSALFPQAKFDPISPNLDLQALVEKTKNFDYVTRVTKDELAVFSRAEFEQLVFLQVILGGRPLVIEGWESDLPRWLFSPEWLIETCGTKRECFFVNDL